MSVCVCIHVYLIVNSDLGLYRVKFQREKWLSDSGCIKNSKIHFRKDFPISTPTNGIYLAPHPHLPVCSLFHLNCLLI